MDKNVSIQIVLLVLLIGTVVGAFFILSQNNLKLDASNLEVQAHKNTINNLNNKIMNLNSQIENQSQAMQDLSYIQEQASLLNTSRAKLAYLGQAKQLLLLAGLLSSNAKDTLTTTDYMIDTNKLDEKALNLYYNQGIGQLEFSNKNINQSEYYYTLYAAKIPNISDQCKDLIQKQSLIIDDLKLSNQYLENVFTDRKNEVYYTLTDKNSTQSAIYYNLYTSDAYWFNTHYQKYLNDFNAYNDINELINCGGLEDN